MLPPRYGVTEFSIIRIMLSFMEALVSKVLSSIFIPTDSMREEGSEALIALRAEFTFPIFIISHLLLQIHSFIDSHIMAQKARKIKEKKYGSRCIWG